MMVVTSAGVQQQLNKLSSTRYKQLLGTFTLNTKNNKRSTSTSTSSTRPIVWKHIKNLVPYSKAYQFQNLLVQHKIKNSSSLDWLILLEHSPIYTTGRRHAHHQDLNHSHDLLLNKQHPQEENHHHPDEENFKTQVFQTLRGGQLTFHGPGQLVGYPILNLKPLNLTVRIYVDLLMNLIRKILLHPSIPVPIQSLDPKENPSLPIGIFIESESKKIASIGVQVKRRITSHGFALNVTEESELGFKSIVACGLKNTTMISINSILKQNQTRDPSLSLPSNCNSTIHVSDLILPTVELFGQLTDRDMKEMDSTCEELDPVGYQLVEQFIHSNQDSDYRTPPSN